MRIEIVLQLTAKISNAITDEASATTLEVLSALAAVDRLLRSGIAGTDDPVLDIALKNANLVGVDIGDLLYRRGQAAKVAAVAIAEAQKNPGGEQ